MCLNENVTNNCVAHWPGRATAAPEWQWLLGNDQAIMCHRRWVIKPISRPFISGAYFLVSVSCSCSSSTFLLSNSLCITVCLQPFLSAASPCSLLILFEVASLLTVWSKNKNDRELFFFFFASFLHCSCSSCPQPLFCSLCLLQHASQLASSACGPRPKLKRRRLTVQRWVSDPRHPIAIKLSDYISLHTYCLLNLSMGEKYQAF